MAPLTSPDVAQRRRRGLSGRSNRQTAAVMAGASAIALLAVARNSATAAANLPRAAQEQHACAAVMGLRQPGDLYDTCIRSLEKTLSELDQARLVAAGRRTCAQEGLQRGTAAFAECVLNTEQSPAAVGGPSPSVEPNTR